MSGWVSPLGEASDDGDEKSYPAAPAHDAVGHHEHHVLDL